MTLDRLEPALAPVDGIRDDRIPRSPETHRLNKPLAALGPSLKLVGRVPPRGARGMVLLQNPAQVRGIGAAWGHAAYNSIRRVSSMIEAAAGSMRALLCLLLVLWVSARDTTAQAAPFVTTNATWKMLKGWSEASADLSAWRQGAFDDAAWINATAPIFYSTASIEPPFFAGGAFNGTTLADMQFAYSSVFLRKAFVVANSASLAGLQLIAASDDGFIAWINGVEVARENLPAGDIPFNGFAQTPVAEPVPLNTYTIANGSGLLINGTNLLALQVFNRSLDSSDFGFMAELSTIPDPGAGHGPDPIGSVGDTHFEPNRGFYFDPLDVRIWVNTPGATLVYTTDGSDPSLGNGTVAAGTNATIHITTTTLLRAAAFKEGYEPSNVDTHTYIFPASVANQARPPGVGPLWPGGYPADFAMDARVSNNPLPGYSLTNALLGIPSISIVMPPENLWGAASGIYANSTLQVERAASFEMLFARGAAGIQENAGLSVRGYSSEIKSLTPKHSFNAVFRRKYGATKLEFPVFPDTAVDEFNALVLRGNVLDSWVNSERDWNKNIDGEMRWYRTRAGYVRDQWMRDTQLAQGQPAGHGRFVHLYLDGYYWGIYNLDERLDEKFAALHLGGDAEEYDVIADGELKGGNLAGWNQLMSLSAGLSSDANYQRLMGRNADGTRNPNYPVLLDLTNLVDYMILHIYAGADDWPWHNWVAVRRRTAASTGFKFLAWDQELSINSLVKQHTDTGALYAEVTGVNTPAHVYSQCRANAEFRQFFADRVQRHLFNGGALSVSNNIARYDLRVAEIDQAIVAESARWGDFYRPSRPYRREVEWLGTNQWMRTVFFPSNHFIALRRFRNANLYPALSAPVFSQFGGPVPAGHEFSITNPNAAGAIYLTLNGVDPRRPGGTPAATAQVYLGPLAINPPTLVRARVRNGSQWSALVETIFYPPQDLSGLSLSNASAHPLPGPVTISEIMYHPPAGADEFVELWNVTSTNVPMFDPADPVNTWKLDGVGFSFPTNVVLQGNGYLLLVATDPATFRARYSVPDGVPVLGPYPGLLQDSGERIKLQRPPGPSLTPANVVIPDITVDAVRYNDKSPWPSGADGGGLSLQRLNPATDGDDPINWQAAIPTPGRPLLDTDGDGLPDWWEIANDGNAADPDAEADPDGDGFTNRQEYLTGTHPMNAASAFRIESALPDSAGHIVVRFSGGVNRSYTVYVTTSLAPPVFWTPVPAPARHDGGAFSIILPDIQRGELFFRLGAP